VLPSFDEVRDIPYVAGLSADEMHGLARRLRARGYRPGEMIFWQGDRCQGLYIVLRGRVRIFRVSPAGREVVVRVLGPGRTFADPAVFDDGPLPASAAAVDPSVVGVLPTRDVFALIDSHPRVARAVLRLLSERIRSFAQLVEEGATRDIVTRVAALLLDVARGRGPLVEDNAPGSLQLTHQSVAAMIGSVREVVQRALKLLESAGTVKLSRGRIHIADRRVLERWSEMPGRR